MEKMVITFGFVLFCLFFFLGLLTVNIWLWGCLPSSLIMLFGVWFEE